MTWLPIAAPHIFDKLHHCSFVVDTCPDRWGFQVCLTSLMLPDLLEGNSLVRHLLLDRL